MFVFRFTLKSTARACNCYTLYIDTSIWFFFVYISLHVPLSLTDIPSDRLSCQTWCQCTCIYDYLYLHKFVITCFIYISTEIMYGMFQFQLHTYNIFLTRAHTCTHARTYICTYTRTYTRAHTRAHAHAHTRAVFLFLSRSFIF